MSNICNKAMKAWIQMVDESICELKHLDNRALKYDDKYHPRFDTECAGAYWALRAMIRDDKMYTETVLRMDQYFNAKCYNILEAFYSITEDEEN